MPEIETPIEDMTLNELFNESDRVGDKYLSDEEIAKRTERFNEAVAEFREAIAQTLQKFDDLLIP